jgi:hypothetical protein
MSLIKTLQKRTIPQASDSELVDEKIYPLYPSQKAETAVPEYEQNDWQAEQNQGRPERWHTFESP